MISFSSIDTPTTTCCRRRPCASGRGYRRGDRIRAGRRTRLEQNLPHREAVRRALAVLAMPYNAPLGMRCVSRTVDAIWRAADAHYGVDAALEELIGIHRSLGLVIDPVEDGGRIDRGKQTALGVPVVVARSVARGAPDGIDRARDAAHPERRVERHCQNRHRLLLGQ